MLNEEKLKTLEEKAANALEVATKTNEKREKKESTEIRRFIYAIKFQIYAKSSPNYLVH